MMGDANSFCLKWNKYSEVFLDTFSHLWSSQEFADVTLFCDGRILRCHRVVLSACSSYFQAMLTGNTHPNPIIFLSDIRFEDLQALIQFVYTGVVTVSQERLSAVVKVGEALKIKGLGESSDSDEIQTEELNKRCVSERQNSSEGETSLKRRRVESNNQVYTSVLPVLDQDTPSSLANTKLPTNDVLLQSAECEESLLEDIEDTHHLSVKEEFRDIEIESSESFGLVNSPDEESYNESKQHDQSSFNNSSFVASGEASGSQNLATVNSQEQWSRILFAAVLILLTVSKRKPTLQRIINVIRKTDLKLDDVSPIHMALQIAIQDGQLRIKEDQSCEVEYYALTPTGRQFANESFRIVGSHFRYLKNNH